MKTIKIRIPLNVTIPVTEGMAVEQMNAAFKKLIKVGSLTGDPSDFVLSYDINNTPAENCVVVEINEEALVDPAGFLTVGGGLCLQDPSFNWEDMKVELPKTFSAQTIKERLRIKSKPPRVQFRYVVLDYRRYWNSIKDSASKESAEELARLFISDLMQMFNLIIPEIQEGKQLQTLLGLNQVSNKLSIVAKDLSLKYKRALKQEQTTGAPSKTGYLQLVESYRAFISALLPEVFEGIENLLNSEETPAETSPETQETASEKRTYSRTSDGRIDLFS